MPPADPSSDSTRRHATVLYADISGFTALSEKLDPEDVTAVMNRVFERLEEVVVARGGLVNKYIGDCVMAVFGLTPGDTQAARQAVRAAMEMRAAVYRYNDEAANPSRLDIHVGVNTGPVVTGEIGGAVRREFTVMGDTVGLAARLEDASARGQIFVGPRTFEETAAEFDYRALDPLPSRNGAAPVPIYELVAEKPRRRHATRDSERRQATVVFADVAGFEALADHYPPEALTALLNRCFAALEAIVRAYGGVVDKYIGECLMALFGVPNAIENAPRQAINAAIEIRNRLDQFVRDEALPVPLAVHMGVNSGLVIAGEIGGRVKRDFTVMGDTVNLAARLKEAAGHGAILVAPETYRHTQDAFAYLPPRALELKGKGQPVPAYELTSVRQQVHRAKVGAADRRIASALVGRDRELAALQACFGRVLAGEGGIVSVVGEAGLGKSRLMAEALAYAPLCDATVLEGRSTSIGQNLSFHPFVDLLRQWAGIGDDQAEGEPFGRLAAAVTGLMPAEAGDVLPFVATLMGMHLEGAHASRVAGIEGEALEKLIFKSVRELVERMAAHRPLVLVFEDLHWADISSVHLLETLLPLVTAHPILFVHVFRPDYRDTAERVLRTALATDAARHTEVRVEPLDARQAATLVGNLLQIDDLPAATRALVTRRAEGNPFYIEEVVRSLIDQGGVEYVDGRFRVTAKIDSVVVPGTIQEVIMTRVDRLDEPTRHLLQVASVIGRNFYYRIIAEIARRQGETGEELAAELGRLQEKQLLLQRSGGFGMTVGDRTLGQELEYIFAHALAQETVYQSILQKTRKEFHHTVAESIESLFADRLSDFFGMLAHHYSRAEDVEKAEEYLFKAGEEAARSAASDEALALFREASRLYIARYGDGGDPRKKALLEKNIALALHNRGDFTESLEHFDRALEHLGERVAKTAAQSYVRLGVDFAAVAAQVFLGWKRPRIVDDWDREREKWEVLFNRGRAEIYCAPTRLFVDTVAGFRQLNRIDASRIDQAGALYASCASVFCYSGISFAVSRRALEIAKGLIRPGSVQDRFTCASMHWVQRYLEGDWDPRHAVDEALVDEAVRYGQLWDANTYLGLRCDQHLRRGEFAAARAALAQLAHLRDAYGYGFAGANHDGMHAVLLAEARDLPDALATIDRYLEGRQEDPMRTFGLGTKAKVQLLLDDLDGAATTLAAAQAIVDRSREVPPWHRSAYAAARLRWVAMRLEAGGDAAARTLAAPSIRYGRRVAAVAAMQRTEILQLVGRVEWALGRRRQALAAWRQALEVGARLGAEPELARTYAEAAGRLGAARLGDLDAAACRREAQTRFARLGLDRDLARLTTAALAA